MAVLNMKVTLILRIVWFSFPNTYRSLTVCVYFIWVFVCVKKETQAVLVQDCEREAASLPPLCYQCHEVAKTLFCFLQTHPSG